MLQFVPIAPCPVAGHHQKESGPIVLTSTLISIFKVPSQCSLLQAKQAQLPQSFLLREITQGNLFPHLVILRNRKVFS